MNAEKQISEKDYLKQRQKQLLERIKKQDKELFELRRKLAEENDKNYKPKVVITISELLLLFIEQYQYLNISYKYSREYEKSKSKEDRARVKLARLKLYQINHKINLGSETVEQLTKIVKQSANDKQIIELDNRSSFMPNFFELFNKTKTIEHHNVILKDFYK